MNVKRAILWEWLISLNLFIVEIYCCFIKTNSTFIEKKKKSLMNLIKALMLAAVNAWVEAIVSIFHCGSLHANTILAVILFGSGFKWTNKMRKKEKKTKGRKREKIGLVRLQKIPRIPKYILQRPIFFGTSAGRRSCFHHRKKNSPPPSSKNTGNVCFPYEKWA